MKLIQFFIFLCIGGSLQAHDGFPQNSDESLIINNELPSIDGNSVIDYVTNIIENTKLTPENTINEINKSLEKLIGNFDNHIQNINLKTLNDIERNVKNVELNIIGNNSRENEDKKGIIKICLENYRPELNEAIATSKNETNQCIIKSKNEIIGIRDDIKKYTDAIENEINNILRIYKKCIKSLRPILVVNCLRKNTRFIKKSLLLITHNAKLALKQASLRLIQIGIETKQCLEISIQHAEERVQAVINKILQCIENGIAVPTTEVPDESETTTETPEVSTEEPEIPTEEPEVPTEEPELPTEEPEVPTEEPELPTEEPELPTKEPEVPTEEPEVPTEEPEVPTEAPEVPTEAPEIPTEEPEVPTDSPEIPTEQPEM